MLSYTSLLDGWVNDWILRLDDQEMDLRDFANMKKEFDIMSASKQDLVYRVATVTGLHEVGV